MMNVSLLLSRARMFFFFLIWCISLFAWSSVFAWWCYMPRYDKTWTVTTKQAVYIRSMPCMEEWWTVVTARGGEQLTVTRESDGWYEVTRADGTQWRIYHTRLTNINVTDRQSSPVVATPSSYQTQSPLSTSMKKKLDLLLEKFSEKVEKIAEERWMNVDDIKAVVRARILAMKEKNPQKSAIFDYIAERL